ncbi:MAG: transposase [Chitinophagales bacterium]|nr:transposase [Chitinophagales bacterium]
MAFAYTIKDQHGLHFVTFTVHQWADVFTRRDYADILINSLKFCQKEKGLLIFGWVIMSNHIHLIIQSTKTPLSDIIRDFKKYTATQIVNAIRENTRESRRNWLLWLFKKEDKIWFWEEGYHAEAIFTEDFFKTKLIYIHQNPVRAGIVEKEEEYLLSSCGDYYGVRNGLLELAPL